VLQKQERGFGGLIFFETVEVFQKQQPGGLLGIIQLAGASGILPENVVDILEACSNIKVFPILWPTAI
jgi:hypothetical protein